MPIFQPNGDVAFPEFYDLADRVTNGDGLVWGGDPDLWLGVGVVHDRRLNRTGHRLEVWRHTESGEDVLIGTWSPAEAFRVVHDLAVMRAGFTGRIESAESRIDKANDAKEKAEEEARVQEVAEQLERDVYDYVHKQEGHAKTTFGVDGLASE